MVQCEVVLKKKVIWKFEVITEKRQGFHLICFKHGCDWCVFYMIIYQAFIRYTALRIGSMVTERFKLSFSRGGGGAGWATPMKMPGCMCIRALR